MAKNLLNKVCVFSFSLIILGLTSCLKKDDAIYPKTPTPVKTETTVDDIIKKDTSFNIFQQIGADTASKTKFYYDYDNLNINNIGRGWQGCPSIGIYKGRLYAAFMASGTGETPGGYIMVTTSEDMGETWTEFRMAIAYATPTGRTFDPLFWNDKYGALHLSWTGSEGFWDGSKGGAWSVRIKTVKDKLVITKPEFLFHGVMNTKPIPLEADSSQMLMPVEGWNVTGTTLSGYQVTPTLTDINGILLYKSGYNPATKQMLPPNKFAKVPTNFVRTFDEPSVVSLDANNMVCLSRSEVSGTVISRSTDGGNTWSTQSLFKDVGATAAGRVYFGRLKSGNLLLILNNSTSREKMTAFLSTDQGKTWPYKLLIDARMGSSYPDVIQNSTDDICMVYDWARGAPNGNIIFAKFNEQTLIKGGPISKTIISKLR
ncbi:sialidase family protein [Mucilaginibacter glaciei]|uniref:Exo-alpha-sialidase n=1 Tax=Mucilaginibacter glaciei TaxID=2772109 RepID=A0A926NJQ9_9SPHI|nr:sialidase family protein [Mucilaginibacter glaciei]MBD1393344.1 exo-alpha-sialidase [Mucilaginibacter glaciei]